MTEQEFDKAFDRCMANRREEIEIGDNVWVGPYTLLEGSNAKLKIGDFVSINAGVMIYTHDSTKYYVSGGEIRSKKVT